MIAAHDVALYASGHLHWAWKGRFNDTSLVWGPSAAFIIGTMEREMPGQKLVGAVLHDLGDDVMSKIVAVPGMVAHVLDNVVAEVYPHEAHKVQKEPAQ
jgi:alkaline phosphatase D